MSRNLKVKSRSKIALKSIDQSLRSSWTVIYNNSQLEFETLDAAVSYASGIGSASKSIQHINPRMRVITFTFDSDSNLRSEELAA